MTKHMKITQQLLSGRRDIELIGTRRHLRLSIKRYTDAFSNSPSGTFTTAALSRDEALELHRNIGEWLEENKPTPEEILRDRLNTIEPGSPREVYSQVYHSTVEEIKKLYPDPQVPIDHGIVEELAMDYPGHHGDAAAGAAEVRRILGDD